MAENNASDGVGEEEEEEEEEQDHDKMSEALLARRLIDGASQHLVSSSPHDDQQQQESSSSTGVTTEAAAAAAAAAAMATRAASTEAATAAAAAQFSTGADCACNWGDQCRRFQQLFTQVRDQEYGGGHLIPLPMSSNGGSRHASTSKKTQVWEEGLRASLGRRDNDNPHHQSADSDSSFWHVAPHHFDRRQIQWIQRKLQQHHHVNDRQRLVSRPVDYAELSRITNSIDKRFKIKDKSAKKPHKYFNLPNQTPAQVQEEIKKLKVLSRLQIVSEKSAQAKTSSAPPPPPPTPTQVEATDTLEVTQRERLVVEKPEAPLEASLSTPRQQVDKQQPPPMATAEPRQQPLVQEEQGPVPPEGQAETLSSPPPPPKDEAAVVCDDEDDDDDDDDDELCVMVDAAVEAPPPPPTLTEIVSERVINKPKEQAAALSSDRSLPAPLNDALLVPEYAWSFYNACRKGYRRRRWILALHNVQIVSFTVATIILAVLYGHYYGSSAGFSALLDNHCQLAMFIATIVLPAYVAIVFKSRDRYLNKPNLFPQAFTRTKAEIFKFRTRVGPYQQDESQCKAELAKKIQEIWKTVDELLVDANLALPEGFWEEEDQKSRDYNKDGATSRAAQATTDEFDLEAQSTETTPCLVGKDTTTPPSLSKSTNGDVDQGHSPLSVEEYMVLRLQKRLDRKSSQVKYWQLEQTILDQSIKLLVLSTSATALLSLQWSVPILLAFTTAFSTIQVNGRFDDRITAGTKVIDGLRSAQEQLGMKNRSAEENNPGDPFWRNLVEEAEDVIVQGEIQSFL